MSSAEICVTGLGAVTALGADASTSWTELLRGTIGLQPELEVLHPKLRVYPSAPSRWEAATERLDLEPSELRRLDPLTVQVLCAAEEAVRDAGLEAPLDDELTAICIGISTGAGKSHAATLTMHLEGKIHRLRPYVLPCSMPNASAARISLRFGTRGPAWTTATTCAAGLDAIGQGLMLIRAGMVRRAIVGGSDSMVDDLGVGSLASVRALAKSKDGEVDVLRPFDVHRSGTAIGEAGAVLVLEAADLAERRGAPVRARLRGYASGSDAYHVTAPRPDGSGIEAVMRGALASAGVDASAVQAVFAHGSGTPLNDVTESAAIGRIFGDDHPLMASTKGQLGHTMGASGAINAVFAVRAMEEGLMPANLPCDEVDPECVVKPVLGEAEGATIDRCMVNAFGFGGHNASIILERAPR